MICSVHQKYNCTQLHTKLNIFNVSSFIKEIYSHSDANINGVCWCISSFINKHKTFKAHDHQRHFITNTTKLSYNQMYMQGGDSGTSDK